MTAAQLSGWTPIKVGWRGTEPVVDWCFTEGVDFVDPFFDQTVERCFRDPFRLLFRQETAMTTLAALAARDPALSPSGFVLHSSRCGSTLVAQMLSSLPGTLVLSEPGPLDAILQARFTNPEIPEADQVQWFRWMVAALGQARAHGGSYVIKLDAWATLSLTVIAQAFPEVPWVFVYRNPVEVLVSQLRRRGFHMIPGCLPPELLGITRADVESMPPEEYVAVVLARLLDPVLQQDENRFPLLVEYRELPVAVAGRIAPHFGIEVSPSERRTLLDVARRDAKNSLSPFVEDSLQKKEQASDQLRAYADRWPQPCYAALESRRLASGSGRR